MNMLFCTILGVFWPIQAAFVVGGGGLCDLETPSWSLKTFLGSCNTNRMADYHHNRCWVPGSCIKRKMLYDFNHFLPIQASFMVAEPLCGVLKTSLEPIFLWIFFWKQRGFITNVTTVYSWISAKRDFFVQVNFVTGEPIYDLEPPLLSPENLT